MKGEGVMRVAFFLHSTKPWGGWRSEEIHTQRVGYFLLQKPGVAIIGSRSEGKVRDVASAESRGRGAASIIYLLK
jgi:hypothetical protein